MAALLALLFVRILLFSALKSVAQSEYNAAPRKLQMNGTLPVRITSSTFDNTTRKTISLIAAVNYAGAILNIGPICTEGIQIAIDNVKRTARNLDKYEVVVDPFDDMCTRPVTVSKFINAMRQNDEASDRFPLMMGSHCTGQFYTGQMLQHFNFIGLIMGTAVADIYKNRNMFRNSFLVTPSPLVGYTALADFFKMMSWNKFAIIGESSEIFHELENQFVTSLTELSNGSKLQLAMINLPYISGIPVESAHIQRAMEELRPLDARIILIDSSTPSRIACWLHRYKLFGPNYVFFVYSGFMFSPSDPLRFTEWCTENMLKEILQSFFTFGISDITNLYGEGVQDMTSMTGKTLFDLLNQRIDNPNKNPYWWSWKTVCYDNTITAGFLLDDIERRLQMRNQTLSDWFVDGRKFQERGREIVSFIKDSLFSIKLETLSGEMMFDRNTSLNAGNMSVTVFQMQDGVPVPVAVQDNTRKLKIGPGKVKWRTASGRPPIDSIHVVQLLVSPIPEELHIFIMLISSLQLAATVVAICYQIAFTNKNPLVKNSVPVVNGFILVGNVFFQLFSLVQPWKSTLTSNYNCMAAYGCLFIGMPALVAGLAAKLSLIAVLMYNERAKKRESERSSDCLEHHHRTYRSKASLLSLPFENHVKINFFLCLLMITVHLAVTIALFIVDPFTSSRVNSTLEMSPNDDSLAYQKYYYECTFGTSSVTSGIIGFIFVSYAALLFRSGFLAYITRQKSYEQVIDSRHIANCLYGTVVMLGCGGITAGAIFANNPTNMRLTISFTLFLLSGLNLCTIFLPQLAKPEQIIPANQKASIANGLLRHAANIGVGKFPVMTNINDHA